MDFLQIILGRYILEFLGASIRYVYLNIESLIKNNNSTSFSNVWSPDGNKKKNESGTLNHMVGVIFFGMLIFLLIIFNT
jgi:hypothetical protein